MRLQQHVGDDHRVLQVGVLALVPRILIAADVVPGPAVEAALLDVRDVVGDQVVAQLVALVDRRPQLARVAGGRRCRRRCGCRRRRRARRCRRARTPAPSARSFSAGVVSDRRRWSASRPRRTCACRRARTRCRASSGRRRAAARRRAARRRPSPPGRAPSMSPLLYGSRTTESVLRDVDPPRIVARRIERDAERLVEPLREHARPRRPAAGEQAADDAQLAAIRSRRRTRRRWARRGSDAGFDRPSA